MIVQYMPEYRIFVWEEGLKPPVSNFKGQQENLFSLTLLNSAAFKSGN
jgi:hypothetical protein